MAVSFFAPIEPLRIWMEKYLALARGIIPQVSDVFALQFGNTAHDSILPMVRYLATVPAETVRNRETRNRSALYIGWTLLLFVFFSACELTLPISAPTSRDRPSK